MAKTTMRNLTKADRLQDRQNQFTQLIAKGFIQITYKDLDFFYKVESEKKATFKAFRGTAANPCEYVYCSSMDGVNKKIASYKANYESREAYKAEQKIKNKSHKSSHAAASAAIKKELATIYPNIKFSCKSDSFSGGDSVHVSWTDGPTTEGVNDIIKKYQYGTFNGMEDLYENTNNRDDIPQAKYVQSSRNMSEAIAVLKEDFKTAFDLQNGASYNDATMFFNRVYYKTPIPHDATNFAIVNNDGVNCNHSESYKLTFDTANKPAPTTTPTIEANEIEVIDYSEKAIAVTGNFSNIYDQLIALGGAYNSRLKCGKGIIFSKKKQSEVLQFLNTLQPIEAENKPVLALLAPSTPVVESTQENLIYKLDTFKEQIKNFGITEIFYDNGELCCTSIYDLPSDLINLIYEFLKQPPPNQLKQLPAIITAKAVHFLNSICLN